MSDIEELQIPCTEAEVAEALHLASLMGKDTQLVKVIRRLAFERDKIAELRALLQEEWRKLGDDLEGLAEDSEDESDTFSMTLGRRGMIYTVRKWMGDTVQWRMDGK